MIVYITWGSVGFATAATYVSYGCPCPLLFNCIYLWQFGAFYCNKVTLAMFALAHCCSTLFFGIINYLEQFGLHVLLSMRLDCIGG